MESIVVNELNNLSVSNPNASIRDISNYQTCDELNVGENNVQYGESKFARNKRKAKTASKVISFTTLLVAAVATGSLIVNAYLGEAPTIKDFETSYVIEDDTFKYNFDVTIDKITINMNVYLNDIIIDSYPFNQSGIYQGEVHFEASGKYDIKFISTNSFDYHSEIEKYHISYTK